MLEEQIQMVDLHGQYLRFKEEINGAMQAVTDSCAFINGPQVKTLPDIWLTIFRFHM